MVHDPRKLLFDLIEACKKVKEFTVGLAFEQFTSNDLVKSAVHMQFIVIGEALIRLRATDSGIYASIPEADRTIAFRHVLAHGYDVIVDEIVWEIVQEKVPVLLDAVQRLFSTNPHEDFPEKSL